MPSPSAASWRIGRVARPVRDTVRGMDVRALRRLPYDSLLRAATEEHDAAFRGETNLAEVAACETALLVELLCRAKMRPSDVERLRRCDVERGWVEVIEDADEPGGSWRQRHDEDRIVTIRLPGANVWPAPGVWPVDVCELGFFGDYGDDLVFEGADCLPGFAAGCDAADDELLFRGARNLPRRVMRLARRHGLAKAGARMDVAALRRLPCDSLAKAAAGEIANAGWEGGELARGRAACETALLVALLCGEGLRPCDVERLRRCDVTYDDGIRVATWLDRDDARGIVPGNDIQARPPSYALRLPGGKTRKFDAGGEDRTGSWLGELRDNYVYVDGDSPPGEDELLFRGARNLPRRVVALAKRHGLA